MIQLQSVSIAHAELLAGMHKICFAEPWSPQAMTEILTMPGCFGLLAVDGDSVIPSAGPPGPAGFVLCRVTMDEAEILSIAVLPPWRKSGIGKQLLGASMSIAASNNACILFLEVAADNLAAQNLYQNCGFTQVGVRKGYYGDKDAFVLRSHL